ncbi:hypothetical protein [Herbidospora sp. NBRC 101105]|uniref:hypothetical protein n=1 Tax=Herbidospora sp. NBRC 101105 TaxID=3032195 RepID=UPI0024A5AFA8|nr:hypothetical protein [Herbidospora sp. NBRC 101105]GLX93051.1 hypothetical protein Hesp01_10010 [Herbidospora sp. NBRC 101105]
MTMFKKALAVAVAAATLASAAPAAAETYTIRVLGGDIGTVKESNSTFFCPEHQMLIGRAHTGDENGTTTYYCGQIYVNDVRVEVLPERYWVRVNEPNSVYTVPDGYALTGRYHYGDEKGYTVYYAQMMRWQGKAMRIVGRHWTADMKESKHVSLSPTGEIMTGRYHYGDENGRTAYEYAKVAVDG